MRHNNNRSSYRRRTSGHVRTLGDKVEAKLPAEKVGVPLAPWSGGPVETLEDARRHAEAIGSPSSATTASTPVGNLTPMVA
jgi:pyruvate carboxylase